MVGHRRKFIVTILSQSALTTDRFTFPLILYHSLSFGIGSVLFLLSTNWPHAHLEIRDAVLVNY